MTELAAFLDRLFADGDVVFAAPPRRAAANDPAVMALLRSAYEDCRREVAGPQLPFRPETALAAAEFLRHACWFLLSRQEPAEVVERELRFGVPRELADHLSADVLLRYLPLVERRARALDPSDTLSRRLVEVLRAWPLSGVLADLVETPLTAPNFDGHRGLLMLYAERLSAHEKPSWLPTEAHREVVELVYAALGRSLPETLATAQS